MKKKKPTVNELLAELPDQLRATYKSLNDLGLSSDKVKSFKERILQAAAERQEKGGLFFLTEENYKYATTTKGASEIYYLLFESKMNEGELAILQDIAKETGGKINLLPERKLEKDILEIRKSFEEKGLQEILSEMKADKDFALYLVFSEKYGEYATSREVFERIFQKDKGAESFLFDLHEIFFAGEVMKYLYFLTYEFLRSRDWNKILPCIKSNYIFVDETIKDIGKAFVSQILEYALDVKAKGVTLSKYASLLKAPIKELQNIGSPSGQIVMSKPLALKQYKWLIDRNEIQEGKDTDKRLKLLVERTPTLRKDIEAANNKAETKGDFDKAKVEIVLKETVNKDLFSLPSTTRTVYRALMEKAVEEALSNADFDGKLKYINANELAEECGFSIYDNHNNKKRLLGSLDTLSKFQMAYFEQAKGNFSLSVMNIVTTYKIGGKTEKGELKRLGIEVTLNTDFLKTYIKGIVNKKNGYFITASIGKVTEFYRLGKDLPIKKKILGTDEKRKSKKVEIPPYTLTLIDVVESKRSMEGGNNSIGKDKLLKRLGLYRYIKKRDYKTAEWKLQTALAALQYAGFFLSTEETEGAEGKVIEFIF